MDVFEKMKQAIIKVQPGIDETKIVPSARLTEDLEIDSLTKVELALAMEDAFGFYLPDEELENIVTVSDAVALIESKSKEAKLRTQDA
jgi:acyl carrier protein